MGLGMKEEGQTWSKPGNNPLNPPLECLSLQTMQTITNKQCRGSDTWAQSCNLTRSCKKAKKKNELVLKQFDVHKQWRNKTTWGARRD